MEMLLPLASFAFVTSFTPGPNNVLLLASGLRFGFFGSLPHILGIQVGICLQLLLAATGLSYLMIEIPLFTVALKVCGTAYLLYLAWHLRPKFLNIDAPSEAKPFSFWQAAMFQFINPKAWVMTLTAGSVFLPNVSSHFLATLLLCLTFNAVGTSSSSSWVLIGGVIRRYLSSLFWRRLFSLFMVALTLVSAVYLWWQ